MLDSFLQSNLRFPCRRGKVRDVYDLGEQLLIVATDRISAFDVIMPNGVPDKGKILTHLSLFWFEKFGRQFEHHLITARVSEMPRELQKYAEELKGRSMLVKKAKVIPIECVARGYLAGSGWKEYQRTHTVCGVALPPGLRQCSKLPAPIFTPATKEEHGHDVNISFEEMVGRIGQDLSTQLRDKTLALYTSAAQYAQQKGIIIADTKFEFGLDDAGRLVLADEAFTPDSSRFWPADEYRPGGAQASFDKQFVRDYCETLGWDKTPPGPELPDEVVEGTRARYVEAFETITGIEFDAYLADPDVVLA